MAAIRGSELHMEERHNAEASEFILNSPKKSEFTEEGK
jgi:hypothetical protein